MSAGTFVFDEGPRHRAMQHRVITACVEQGLYAEDFDPGMRGTPMVKYRGDLLIAPDVFGKHDNKVFLIEIKTKSSMTFHFTSRTWRSGIDEESWNSYAGLVDSGFPVILAWKHFNETSIQDSVRVAELGIDVNSVDCSGVWVAPVAFLLDYEKPLRGQYYVDSTGRTNRLVYWEFLTANGFRKLTKHWHFADESAVDWKLVVQWAFESQHGRQKILPGRLGETTIVRDQMSVHDFDRIELPW